MSKTKNRTHSEIEHLRAENKRLKKQLKHLSRREHHFEKVLDEVAETIEVTSTCGECGKGDLIVNDFKFFELESCTVCDYKKSRKIK